MKKKKGLEERRILTETRQVMESSRERREGKKFSAVEEGRVKSKGNRERLNEEVSVMKRIRGERICRRKEGRKEGREGGREEGSKHSR